MNFVGDYHTHTKASDGRGTIESNVAAAKSRGLKQIAITDHGFTNILCHLTVKKYNRQEEEIAALKESGITVLHGVEGNLANTLGRVDVPDEIVRRAEVLNLGFHRFLNARMWKGAFWYIVINGFFPACIRRLMIEKNTASYISALRTYPVDIVVHPNSRALVDTAAVCKVAAETGAYVELNVKHLKDIEKDLDKVLESGAKLIVGSDAHKSKNVGRFEDIEAFIIKHNIPIERIYGIDKIATFKDKTNWKRDI